MKKLFPSSESEWNKKECEKGVGGWHFLNVGVLTLRVSSLKRFHCTVYIAAIGNLMIAQFITGEWRIHTKRLKLKLKIWHYSSGYFKLLPGLGKQVYDWQLSRLRCTLVPKSIKGESD